ncbi:hypothetical protein HAZT_HAZT001792 [Hyalella azteca]|uniref:DNA topoisomerase n=1 Tax=Hyalella azteca TaxID=294128 RepID=A0A6A0HDY5_HYAAZ|nr:hypothetical protein HAZT_HAZT001792 [Hyalella azteca]
MTFNIGSEVFSLTGIELLDPGFTKVMDWLALDEESKVPDLVEGDKLPITEARLNERQTVAPDYLTEAQVIGLMEKHGIGTDASIPVHINNICQRNYVTVESGRRLVPTNLGIVLVHGYQKIDVDLVLPTMRSAVEEQLNLIAAGKADFDSVLRHTLHIFAAKFQYFVSNIGGMDNLFEVSFSPLSESGKPFSRCGKCKRYMKLVETKPQRLYCATCDDTYAVPPGGNVREYQENKCPLDDFQLLLYSGGGQGRSYTFCPYCYNNAPFPGMLKNSGCNNCLHPTCAFGRDKMGVSQCMECEGGVLVLDPASGPKWKICCNRRVLRVLCGRELVPIVKCDVLVCLFDKASKVNVLSEVCATCGSQNVAVEYKEGKSKFKDGSLSESGCIFCSPMLTPLVTKQRVSYEGNRGRGRGRGGPRGRGRGRGRAGRR